MNIKNITTGTIMDWISEQVETKQPIDPNTFFDAAVKLNVLLGDEQEKLFKLQQECARIKSEKILDGQSVAMAKALLEASDPYREMLSQKAKIDRIIEFIRLSKLHARLRSEEIKGY